MKDIKLEIVQVESIAQILFNWWKRDFESGKISHEEADVNAIVSDNTIKENK
jgi:hypothetical protein